MAVVWPSKNNFANGDVLTATNMNNIADTLNVFNPTSATNGQVPIANGSGGVAYGTPVSGSYTQLTTGALSGSSLTLSSINQTYTDLYLILTKVYNYAAVLNLHVNGVTTTYAYQRINTTGSTPTVNVSGVYNQANIDLNPGAVTTPAASVDGTMVYIRILNYAQAVRHSFQAYSACWDLFSSTGPAFRSIFGWEEMEQNPTLAAITSITLNYGASTVGNYTLYGAK